MDTPPTCTDHRVVRCLEVTKTPLRALLKSSPSAGAPRD